MASFGKKFSLHREFWSTDVSGPHVRIDQRVHKTFWGKDLLRDEIRDLSLKRGFEKMTTKLAWNWNHIYQHRPKGLRL